ncbi:YjbH domain-containing protein [Gammaproteobacteria bacterium]|nr:YjbH domain-containing protein [Gammaproteobacteria bacterium]
MKHTNILLIFFCTSFLSIYASSQSYNSLGQTGLITIPSAEIHDEQSAYFTFNRSNFIKLGTVTITPFDWMEASYFYYRPDDLLWGTTKGLYLDKGFNVKFSYKPKNILLPRIAVGLDDFAGTGQFTREYIITTYDFKSLKFTSGLGWGKYVGESSIKNPLSILSEKFTNRGINNVGKGGTLSSDIWFTGPATPLIGLEYKLKNIKNTTIKIERNPYDYFKFSCCGERLSKESFQVRPKESNINFGLSYKYKDIGNIDLSYIKGNTWNISFSVGFQGNKNYRKKEKFSPKLENIDYKQKSVKNEFYLDLLHNLNKNNLYLQTANLDKKALNVSIESLDHTNPVIYSSRTAYIANEVAKFNDIKLDNIETGHINRGIKINSAKYYTKDLNLTDRKPDVLVKRTTVVENSDNNSHIKHEFRPTVQFPVIINNLSPDIKSHVGSPEKFLYSGFGIKASSEIQFNRNLVFFSSIGRIIEDNFDEKVSEPNSQLQEVRTQIVDYLQASSGDIYIDRMELEHITSPFNNIYTKISFGYLESMYGGVAAEVMYKPFKGKVAMSLEINRVTQRAFDQKFSFSKYKVSTQHFNVAYYHPKTNVLAKWSFGHYLAGDKGYTLDLSRRMPNGWQAGVWFSNTNVSAVQFGEGSFDKGFYMNIPLNLFSKSYSKNSQGVSIRSMTRDGAQKLELRNRLIDSFYGATYNEFNENWFNYLD